MPNPQPDSVLIITATKTEAQAVLEVFSQAAGKQWDRQPIGNKTYYDLGTHGGTPTYMVQSEMGTATPGGAVMTTLQAISSLEPQAIIMCEIAFGLRPDKQRLGDILVAKQLGQYEPQKIDRQRGQIVRGDRVTCAERLLDRFRSGDNDWRGAQTHFGLVLSGEKLVNDQSFRDWLLAAEPEALGGEMEGVGLYLAARLAKVDWILVKAICDWADGTKNDNAQPLAARTAAQFVLHVLQQGGLGESETSVRTRQIKHQVLSELDFSAIVDLRIRARDWKELHQTAQSISLKLAIIQGLVDRYRSLKFRLILCQEATLKAQNELYGKASRSASNFCRVEDADPSAPTLQ